MKKNYLRAFRGAITVLLAWLSLTTFAQDRKVSGKVSDASGAGIPGASVVVKGTTTGTSTDVDGNYSLNVKGAAATLAFSGIGYQGQEVKLGNQSIVNVTLQDDSKALEEVVVTGYQQLRKKDITGAVTVVNAEELKTIKSSSFVQNLAGRAAGLTVSTSGAPGAATNVRVRGISSFSSNDPLYVIDGVPVVDQYQTSINPNDIESVQVLKDASAASIYGSRASNGVIVITTKQGKAGKAKLTYNGSFGLANAVKGYDEVLNTSSQYYAEAVRLKFAPTSAGIPAWFASTTLPKYVHNANSVFNTVDLATYDPIFNIITETNQAGTNWWKEISRTGKVQDHSINVSGGTDAATFNISASYLNQEGILKLTDFNRGTIRANSNFKIGKKLRVGENIMFASTWGNAGGNFNTEFGPIGNLIKATSIVSPTDIKGGPGGHVSSLTGNFTNPDQVLRDAQNNINKSGRLLGNIFAEYELIDGLKFRTNFGADLGNTWRRAFTFIQPYRSEGTTSSAATNFNETWTQSTTWNTTNTLQYNKNIGKHAVGVLAGQEAIANNFREIYSTLSGYFTPDINAWYINTALGVPASLGSYSRGDEAKLASYFGKVDYAFDDKYLISATVRRDGSSKFTSEKRYGIFPAVSVGWRISQEAFMKDLNWLSDLKLRGSYGELGNQQIRNYNFASIYGGSTGNTFYDINGSNSSLTTGYALTAFGNPDTKWETSKSKNIGFDASLMNNALNVVLDVYSRTTSDLLYNPANPGTAGVATPAFINIAEMLNTGWDLSTNYRKNINKDFGFNLGLTLSHYKNTIQKVSGDADFFHPNGIDLNSRIPNSGISVINKVGYPISSFNGYIVDGLITTDAELKAHTGTGAAAIGGLKFKDVNGDGKIDSNDLAVNGNPHPKLTGGLNIGVNYKNFDLNSFWFGSYGNQIFTGYWIQSYFMNFNADVLNNILENQGKVVDGKAYPKINANDRSSASSSDFYIQDGSYLRMQNLQVGYTLPNSMLTKLGVSKARVYVQGQNLLTLTKYFGVDPNISNANSNGYVNDGGIGLDNGNYPSNKVINMGVTLDF